MSKLAGALAILLAALLMFAPVFGGFILTGFGIGLFLFLGIGGLTLVLVG
jgi:hypothetical protein